MGGVGATGVPAVSGDALQQSCPAIPGRQAHVTAHIFVEACRICAEETAEALKEDKPLLASGRVDFEF